MNIGECTRTDVELNNQLIMGKKLPPKSRQLGNGDEAILNVNKCLKSKEMAQNSALTVEMEPQFGQVESRNTSVSDEPKLSKEDPQETRHLKELLLLHLDWIQQQQETLLAKDRLIMRLKQEKEALKCRLERMDRRMSLLKQKHESPSPPGNVTQRDVGPVSSLSAPPAARAEGQSRGVKRKHSLEPRNLAGKFNDLTRNDKDSACDKSSSSNSYSSPAKTPTKTKVSRLSRSQKLKQSPLKQQPQYLFSQQPPRKCRTQQTPSKLEVESDIKSDKNEDKNSSSNDDDSDTDDEVQILDQSARRRQLRLRDAPLPHFQDNNIMRTRDMYYVTPQVDLPPWDISPKKTKTDDNVVVPTWRIKHVPTGYQLEGTENLTDEVYMKRHQKPEADEKRRKRWDAQMMREKKMVERLQQRSGNTTSGGAGTPSKNSARREEEEDLVSFLPNPDNVKYLEICDEVPVMAFGYPVPEISQSEFTLPWFDASKHSKGTPSSRSSRGHKKSQH